MLGCKGSWLRRNRRVWRHRCLGFVEHLLRRTATTKAEIEKDNDEKLEEARSVYDGAPWESLSSLHRIGKPFDEYCGKHREGFRMGRVGTKMLNGRELLRHVVRKRESRTYHQIFKERGYYEAP